MLPTPRRTAGNQPTAAASGAEARRGARLTAQASALGSLARTHTSMPRATWAATGASGWLARWARAVWPNSEWPRVDDREVGERGGGRGRCGRRCRRPAGRRSSRRRRAGSGRCGRGRAGRGAARGSRPADRVRARPGRPGRKVRRSTIIAWPAITIGARGALGGQVEDVEDPPVGRGDAVRRHRHGYARVAEKRMRAPRRRAVKSRQAVGLAVAGELVGLEHAGARDGLEGAHQRAQRRPVAVHEGAGHEHAAGAEHARGLGDRARRVGPHVQGRARVHAGDAGPRERQAHDVGAQERHRVCAGRGVAVLRGRRPGAAWRPTSRRRARARTRGWRRGGGR
jgi:hypothetical protein